MENKHDSYEYLLEIDYAFSVNKSIYPPTNLPTLQELAKVMSVRSNWVTKNPTIEIIFHLCRALDISLKDFF